MSAKTLIGWTGSTWSPWLGCRKVSEGCVNCYITDTTPFRTRNLVHGGRREYLSLSYWKQPVKWDREALRDGRRHRVFPSLCDWLDDEVPVEKLAVFLDLIRRTPYLDWQLLTKRPQNWKARMEAVMQYATDTGAINLGCFVSCWWLGTAAPHNAWIGVSTENQARADERIPLMFEIPAVLYFISAEPLLESLDIRSHLDRLHWVITGGESSRRLAEKPRPVSPDAFRSLRGQCAAVGVPFFFKQFGDWIDNDNCPPDVWNALTEKQRTHLQSVNVGPYTMHRLGKDRTGNLLDGRTHEEMPEVSCG